MSYGNVNLLILVILLYSIKQNEYELKDSFYFNLNSNSGTFYSVGNRQQNVENKDFNEDRYLTIFLRMSQNYEVYERTTFTLFEVLGGVGGVFEILSIAGSVIVLSLSTQLFNNSLLSKLYQINDKLTTRVNTSQNAEYSKNNNTFDISHTSKILKERIKYQHSIEEEQKTIVPINQNRNNEYRHDSSIIIGNSFQFRRN